VSWIRPPREAEPLAVLLLPAKLEEFERRAQAQPLLEIPRVVAVEPGRWRGRGPFGAEVRAVRQARRLRFPGRPRLLVLYDAAQYPLARALGARYEAELWYAPGDERSEFHELAAERAVATLAPEDAAPLRARLKELEIISPRPFIPAARAGRRSI
jgi:hypothetical protein